MPTPVMSLSGSGGRHSVTVHGNLAHTVTSRGTDSKLQGKGLGEAIAYERGNFRAMIDVGERGAQVHSLYPLHPAWDVLVLTHNDHDHVGDIAAFLTGARPVKEIWMPYEWLLLNDLGGSLVRTLVDTGRPDVEDVDDVRERVAEAVQRIRSCFDDDTAQGSPDWLDDGAAAPPSAAAANATGSAAAMGALGSIVSTAFDTDDAPGNAEQVGMPGGAVPSGEAVSAATVIAEIQASVRHDRSKRRYVGTPGAVAASVTRQGATAARARATARTISAAQRSGARLRWFSADHAGRFPVLSGGRQPWGCSGLPGTLTVVNAWPVLPGRVRGAPRTTLDHLVYALAYTVLSVQNRRALVALGHPEPSVPLDLRRQATHVLFASDSGFEFDTARSAGATIEVPWHLVGAVVGMHHGSATEDHDHLYTCLRHPVPLGRSGSPWTYRTNELFADHPVDLRACTWCHRDNTKPTFCADRPRDVVMTQNPSYPFDWRIESGSCHDCPRFP